MSTAFTSPTCSSLQHGLFVTQIKGIATKSSHNLRYLWGEVTMNRLILLAVLAVLSISTANADVWRWIDPNGITRFVDTNRPIYTWVVDGKVFFADTPGHEDAVSVDLVWHSSETLDNIKTAKKSDDDKAFPSETEAEREERKQAEAYYCKRATEVYDSYLNAPKLYKTNDAGEKQYLTEEEAVVQLAETKARVEELCS